MKHFLRKIIPKWMLSAYHLALAQIATAAYGYPGKNMVVIGVTGTDGKTTTTNMLASVLRVAGFNVSWISTISARIGQTEYDTGPHTTTPSPFVLQSLLRKMKKGGAKYVVLEVTSHGIEQARIGGIPFSAAVLTNITPEHLDYHHTFEKYLKVKAGFLRRVQDRGGTAVVNRDDQSFEKVMRLLNGKVLTYGEHPDADIRAVEINETGTGGSRVVIKTPKESAQIIVNIPGRFNAFNGLAAAAGAYALGLPLDVIGKGISQVKNLAGRMEEIPTNKDFRLVVDFAHTPNALNELLRFWRPRVLGKIILIFGCAGERDTSKRPEMGEIAGKNADLTILTREDNRSEPVEQINKMIASGIERAGKKLHQGYEIVNDRKDAILAGLTAAGKDDLVIITGKGHESGLNVDGREIVWDDRKIARDLLCLLRPVPSTGRPSAWH